MRLFKKTLSDNLIVASIDGKQCRVQYFSQASGQLNQIASTQFEYQALESLEDQFIAWCKKNTEKSNSIRWLLTHELYQTYHTDAPSVLEKEMAEALKWQIKDQIELAIDNVLISYYRPKHPDPENTQLIAVSVEKKLVESLIATSQSAHLILDAIEIEELALGHALLDHLPQDKIVGYVGENKSGLVFNFYQDNQLVFSRFKKGRFIPQPVEQEFSFEADIEADSDTPKTASFNTDDEDAFLLETQRTLDYVIGQLFKKSVDLILLQHQGEHSDSLAKTINQLIETQVILVKPDIQMKLVEDNENSNQKTASIIPTLAEAGSALRVDN